MISALRATVTIITVANVIFVHSTWVSKGGVLFTVKYLLVPTGSTGVLATGAAARIVRRSHTGWRGVL